MDEKIYFPGNTNQSIWILLKLIHLLCLSFPHTFYSTGFCIKSKSPVFINYKYDTKTISLIQKYLNCQLFILYFWKVLINMWGRRCVFESEKKYEKYISKVIPFHFAYKTVCIKYCSSLQKIEEFGFHICWLLQELHSLWSFIC